MITLFQFLLFFFHFQYFTFPFLTMQVIAERDYAPGDQVLIRYGKFSNATLLLDFGFTLPHNIYDQVQIELNVPHHDRLCAMKLELLNRYRAPSIKDVNVFSSSGNSFTIKLVPLSCNSDVI
ncbi:uncharacterized protein LOC111374066 isoform X2 [Olea europaea var. sylvestris]|uniref:uncharacterized protein LOC111374066 isoform X2 n=1 Tax=Olea europaea var. sylvestris TaxID=158386 RepID=UPI000C1D734C|nr:uncharacterized protein LOC111374066 isoform X2 [Olea europaea var. sylvestris]